MDDNNQKNKQSLPSNEGQIDQSVSASENQPAAEPTELVEEAASETPAEETAESVESAEEQPTEAPTESTEAQTEEIAKVAEPEAQPQQQEAKSEAVEATETQPETETSDSDTLTHRDTDTPSEEPTPQAKNDNPNARWYVVHTYSGHEMKVSHTLKQRIESEHLEKEILEVLVPMQDKIEIKSGKKVTVKEKIFPGYILVKMILNDISWLAVRTTQGVTSFVGMGNKPTPISESEVQTIVKFTQTEAPMYKQIFSVNDTVKIVDGPFADFIGKIDSVDEEKGKVRVLVSIFGRETPVELDFLQIKKI